MRRNRWSLSAKGLAAGFLLTGQLVAASASGQAAAYLNLGVDARILGMGGAGSTLSKDVNATYWNPAGLAHMEERQVAFMHTSLSLDRNYNSISYGAPLRNSDWRFGVAYHRFSVDGIPETRIYDGTNGLPRVDVDGNGRFDDPVLTGDVVAGNVVNNANRATAPVQIFSYFEDSESYFSLSVARKFGKKISLGTSLKLFEQSLFTADADGLGLDLGVQYQHSDRAAFGLSVKNMGADLDWSTGRKDNIPMVVTAGTAVKLKSGITVAADVVKREGETMGVRVGTEKWFHDRYGIRVGNNEGEFTLGASAKLKDWNLDYAYNDEDLGSVQRISVVRKF